MDRRLKLHQVLIDASGLNPKQVYYQPHENVRLVYPCIVYSLDGVRTNPADNTAYTKTRGYQVTLLERDPDSPIVDRMLDLPMCTFSTSFVRDNLYHHLFRIYH